MTSHLLDSLNLPSDISTLTLDEKEKLAQEIREVMIHTVLQNGGHLAPSLGVVELTISLLSCFDPLKDKIIWDVGHQCYPWKILTGRYKNFETLRRYGGLSGFPKRSESPYDCFGVGHASTSISAAIGMAVARDLCGGKEHVIAVIGDGALSGGMALEALNYAGGLGKRLIVILNDNKMAISENVGALSCFLSRNLSRTTIMHLKQHVARVLNRLPKGDSLLETIKKGEISFKSFFTPGILFEAFRFNYIGPINGHDIGQVEKHLKMASTLDLPVLLHIRTKKGKGYTPAEKFPSHFHGVGANTPDSFNTPKLPEGCFYGSESFSSAFGKALCELAAENNKIFAITAAMEEGTGLEDFHKRFPNNFADVGICEEHAVTMAAGLSTMGFHPVVAIYSTFMQRALDQVIHDVCLQQLPITFCLDRAGLVGEDGSTHHGAFDLSWLRMIPNMTILAPRSPELIKNALEYAISLSSPTAIRYPRGSALTIDINKIPFADIVSNNKKNDYPATDGEILIKGNSKICMIAIGERVQACIAASLLLSKNNFPLTTVYDPCFIKPLPRQKLLELSELFDTFLFVEENALSGGFSSSVLELLADNDRLSHLKIRRIGIPDFFITHGNVRKLRQDVGLSVASLCDELKKLYTLNEE